MVMANNRNKYHKSLTRTAKSILIIAFLLIENALIYSQSFDPIDTPLFEFALVPQSQRIDEKPFDVSKLEYFSDMEDLGELSIKSKIITMCKISPNFGQIAGISIRLEPENVTYIPGYSLRDRYYIQSSWLSGPQLDYSIITEVNLNELDLLPCVYNVYTNFFLIGFLYFKSSKPIQHTIRISKDQLEILSQEKENQESGISYDIINTFKNIDKKFWRVSYKGRITDSLRRGVELNNVNLYLEISDEYKKIGSSPFRC